MKTFVYAEWFIEKMPEELSEFHISCGVGDEQWDGFFIEDPGATLSIEHQADGFAVRFQAPDSNLSKEEGYWLSPNLLNDEYEAVDWGTVNKL